MSKVQASFDKLEKSPGPAPSNCSTLQLPSLAFSTNYSSHPNSPKLLSPFSNTQTRRVSMLASFRPQFKQSRTDLFPIESPCNKQDEHNLKECSLWNDDPSKSPMNGRRLSKTSSLPLNNPSNQPREGSHLTLTPLSPIKKPIGFAEILMEEIDSLETETIPRSQDRIVSDRKTLAHQKIPEYRRKDLNINTGTESSLNSFEKGIAGFESNPESDEDSDDSDSLDRKNLEGVNSHPSLMMEPKIPLTKMIRRKSCCCSDCGGLSSYEKKHQNVAVPCAREVLNKIHEAFILQSIQQQQSVKSVATIAKDEGVPEQEIIEPVGEFPGRTEERKESLLTNPSYDISVLGSSMKTEGENETVRKSGKKHSGSSSFFKKAVLASASGSLGPRSPKNFVVKSGAGPKSPKLLLSPQNSNKSTEKSINTSVNTSKNDSPVKESRNRLSFLTSSAEENSEAMKILRKVSGAKPLESPKEEKTSVQKNNTMSIFFKRKISEDFTKRKNSDLGLNRQISEANVQKFQKNEVLATKSYFGDSPPMFQTSRKVTKVKKQFIQDIYTKSNGNLSPKLTTLPSLAGLSNKAGESMITPKRSSARPVINIIRANESETTSIVISPKAMTVVTTTTDSQTSFKRESPRKTSINALDAMASQTKHRKSWFGNPNQPAVQDKNLKTEVDVTEPELDYKAFTKKKSDDGSIKKKSMKNKARKKRSLSLEKVLKAYQLVNGKNTSPGKK